MVDVFAFFLSAAVAEMAHFWIGQVAAFAVSAASADAFVLISIDTTDKVVKEALLMMAYIVQRSAFGNH